jgi:hypothetical protein
MGFPRSRQQASVWLYKLDNQWSAYLMIPNQKILSTDSRSFSTTQGYIPGEARQVEWEQLPKEAQTIFLPALKVFGLDETAWGLHKLPEWEEARTIGGYIILKKRTKMRRGNFKIVHPDGKEVKSESLVEAVEYVENHLQSIKDSN